MKSSSNQGFDSDDQSPDDTGSEAASWVPDQIPDSVRRAYESEAHVIVVATRHLRNAARPRPVVLWAQRVDPRWRILLVALATFLTTWVWLGPANGAVAVFVVAVTLAVVTISMIARFVWRRFASVARPRPFE